MMICSFCDGNEDTMNKSGLFNHTRHLHVITDVKKNDDESLQRVFATFKSFYYKLEKNGNRILIC